MTRRTTLRGLPVAFALGGLTACDLDLTGQDPPAPDEAPVDPDRAVIDDALAALAGAIALLRATSAAHPSLRSLTQPLLAAHVRHRAVLSATRADTERSSAPLPQVPDGVADAASAVRRSEKALKRSLAQWALGAESGSFARLLASMSASVAQHLATR